MAKKNSNLHKAAQVKNDEFYTKIADIEKELVYYKSLLVDQKILCNCDDPQMSNFWKYLNENFENLQLKQLVSTHFVKDKNESNVIIKEKDSQGIVKQRQEIIEGDGDFRSIPVIKYLEEADIVITNPPFSLFREYVAQLINYNKKFLIVGSKNAISYKDIFKLIKENKIWLGVTSPKEFVQPDGSIKKFGNIGWFTNLPHQKRAEEIVLTCEYIPNPADYKNYDNFPAIEVSKISLIPKDYKDIMGVPITFLDKYNPNQFEIIGIDRYTEGNKTPGKRMTINGQEIYARILIKKK